jgi:ABC-type polysaccharide/polyol phosphate export permease/GT2 family glycosyltransferase
MSAKVIEMDIRYPKRIDNLKGYDAVEVFFRSDQDLIGRTRILCNQEPVAEEKIRSLVKNLTVPSRPELHADNLPSVTVAICTRNRPESLSNALRFLKRQKHPPDEVIVVDNGGQAEIRAMIQKILPEAKYFIERRPGLNFARNHALSVARADIIAFLDDDALADPFWVLSIAESFADSPEAGAVTGFILPLELETHAQELFEANGGFGRGFSRRVLPDDCKKKFGFKLPIIAEVIGVGSGCNMAFRISILKEINGFDEALDTGPPLPGGGDLDIFYRVLRSGYKLIYEPRAIVHHQHREEISELHNQLTGHYRSLSAFLFKTMVNEKGWKKSGVVLFTGWRLLKNVIRPIKRLFGRDVLPIQLLFSIFRSFLAGFGSYHLSQMRNQKIVRILDGRVKGIVSQLAELSQYRELIWNLTLRDLKVKYKRSWLGFFWTLLNPLIVVVVLVAVFSYIVRIPIKNYWAFLISGYFVFFFFSTTLNGSVQTALGNAYLWRKAYFPKEVLIVSSTLARFLEFLIEISIVLIALMIFHHKGIPFSFIMLLPLLPILFLFTIGVTFPLATLAIYFNDVLQIIPRLTLALFYISPVFYSVEFVPEKFREIYLWNPVAILLNLIHSSLYKGEIPDLRLFLRMSIIAVIMGVVGYIIFNRKKHEFAEIV